MGLALFLAAVAVSIFGGWIAQLCYQDLFDEDMPDPYDVYELPGDDINPLVIPAQPDKGDPR